MNTGQPDRANPDDETKAAEAPDLDENRTVSVDGGLLGDANAHDPHSTQFHGTPTFWIGQLPEYFGRYKVLRTLGKGGMGAVYLAEDLQLDRQVAIKVPFQDPNDKSDVLDRFTREAKSLAAIVHPNICPIHEVGEVNGIHFLAMTYVEGKPLSDYIRPDKPLVIKQAVLLVRKLASALHHAHATGIIHRDLKPSNIIINKLKEPVIMDFGLARREGKSDAAVTLLGDIMGTPHYMSPEQFAGDIEAMGPGCDIYSLGVILYELLTAKRPIDGNVSEIMAKISKVVPPPPSRIRAGIDADLDRICMKALEKKVEDRFASMEEFTETLTNYLKDEDKRRASSATLRPGARDGTVQASRASDATKAHAAITVDGVTADASEDAASDGESATTLVPVGEGYRLVKPIGTGQYGEVWLGIAPGGIEVAVKKILFPVGHRATQSELQALELIKRLRHSFLVQVQAYWVMEDQLMIVMELADGSLEERAAECKRETGDGIPRDELLGYMREAAEAIDFLHGEQVLHRDIKPGNILLVKGHVKVADFGIATAGVLGHDQVTTASATLGTPLYMGPELWNRQAGPRSDQYSLAVTYVELRTGAKPVLDDERRPDLSALPEDEQAVLAKATAADPSDRFESCTQFAQALDEIVESKLRAAEERIRSERQHLKDQRRRRRSLIIAGLALLALMTAGWFVRQALIHIPTSFERAEGAKLHWVDGKLLYDRIDRVIPSDAGDIRVELLLIRQTAGSDVGTFYCMRDKVSNRLFETFINDPSGKFKADSQWERGALAGNQWLAAKQHPDNPVFSVSVDDAHAFAQWLGGMLPTVEQWDKAAGRWDHDAAAEGPYRGPWDATADARKIAVNRLSEGPLPVGTAEMDIGPFGCRDMAGNGREWTRNLDEVNKTVPVAEPSGIDFVIVRGRGYGRGQPLHYRDLDDEIATEAEPYLFSETSADVSFRCVIELPVK